MFKRKIKKIFSFLTVLTLLLPRAFAFTLPETEINIEFPVYINEIDLTKYYAVFLPFEEPTNGEVCATVSGEELAENNNLKKYGTCFVNDEGTFTIVEISEPFSSSYEDLVENNQVIQEEKVNLSVMFEKDVSESTSGVITDLEKFIEDTKREVSRILGGLKDTEESSSGVASDGLEENVLGAKTYNILSVLQENFLILEVLVLIISTIALLLYILKKYYKNPKKKK